MWIKVKFPEKRQIKNILDFVPICWVRELRGKIIRLLLEENQISVKEVENKIEEDESKIITAITGVKNDGLLKISKNNIIEII